jgi:hypothetical protein
MIKLRHALCLSVLVCFVLTATLLTDKGAAQSTRDPWLWPFAQDSIWNMPIGDKATYVPANLGRYGDEYVDYDFEYMIKVKASDPEVPLYYPSGISRCEGNTISWLGKMRVPYSFTTERIRQGYTPNEVATFLQPDNKTIWQTQPTTRCTQGGPIYGYPYTGINGNQETLYGQGEYGTHYGSGLSGIGGSLRKGELTGSAPIRHALKINLWGKRYIYKGKPNGYGAAFGYRWPARMADTGADDPNSANAYLGTNPELAMGSLLAIPATMNQSSLGLQTEVGRKLFYTLQKFGAYVVDNTAWYPITLCGEKGVPEEVKAAYGQDMLGSSSPIAKDILKLYQQLYVVTNNSPTSKGGPGNRLAPLAPEFGSSTTPTPTPVPTPVPGSVDLTVTDISWTPANPVPGSSVTFSATIKNQGTAASPNGVIHGVAFYVNGTFVSWSDNTSASLVPGASRTVTANGGPTGSGMWSAIAGTHIVEAFVDDIDRIPDEADENNNKRQETISVSTSTPTPDPGQSFTIALNKNWNLISLPIQPTDTDIADVLSGISGKYAVVYAWNGTNYETYLPGDASSDLKRMEAGRGYWVFMNQAVSLQIKGARAGKSITLGKEWNLVGYNSTTSMTATQALASTNGKVSVVYLYNTAENEYEIVNSFQPGLGYWMYASENVIWTLP